MTWEHILKGETIRKGDWEFTTWPDVENVEVENSPFEQMSDDERYPYDMTEYEVDSFRLNWTIDIELRDYGIKNLSPYGTSAKFTLRIGDERFELDDMIFEDENYKDNEGMNIVKVPTLTIDMKNDKDESKWYIVAYLERG